MAREKKIGKASEKKTKAVEDLAKLMKESRSVVIVSIKNLPAKQFQLIKKKLKDNASIKVLKKNISNRAIDSIEKGAIKNLKKYLREDTAFIFSKLNPFELSAFLSKNKSKARAKAGQEVDEDVVIETGPTELVPGPVVSELGSLGIKFAIEDGKIGIKERKVILKAGEQVNEQAASIMTKLDIKPIAIGLEPLIAYDSKEDKIYEDIKIDQEKTAEELKQAASKALAFAIKIAYVCKETIGFLLRKAASEKKILEKFIKCEKEEVKTTEKDIQQNKQEQEEK
jgi:large subunit ribosomal protein L10